MKLPTARSFSAIALLLLMAFGATIQVQAAPVHNIVLVHGGICHRSGMATCLRDSGKRRLPRVNRPASTYIR
jgi:hypothetical protein